MSGPDFSTPPKPSGCCRTWIWFVRTGAGCWRQAILCFTFSPPGTDRRDASLSLYGERRIKAGLNPKVGSVASVFISRWDVAVAGKIPTQLINRLGIAIAFRIYKAYVELIGSPSWQRAFNEGAIPQRLLWASTGTKDPKASDTLYIESLACPLTVNTMPEGTLKAFADHGKLGATIPASGGDSETVLNEFAKAGVDVDALAIRLQEEGADSFDKSWNDLLKVISSKSAALQTAA